MNVVIIQYNAGNIRSVEFALRRIGIEATITSDAEEISRADKVIFPGVGEASSAMKFLMKNNLDRIIPALTQPVLGICLGMQLLCNHSEENNTTCLKVFDTNVIRLNGELKVPHVGWNTLENMKGSLFEKLGVEPYCYFVHSYVAELCPFTIAETTYGKGFSSALQKDNFFGVQFHPEKSAAQGQSILKSFIELK